MRWHVRPAASYHTLQHWRAVGRSRISLWRCSWLVACYSTMFTFRQFIFSWSLLKHASLVWLVHCNAAFLDLIWLIDNVVKQSNILSGLFYYSDRPQNNVILDFLFELLDWLCVYYVHQFRCSYLTRKLTEADCLTCWKLTFMGVIVWEVSSASWWLHCLLMLMTELWAMVEWADAIAAVELGSETLKTCLKITEAYILLDSHEFLQVVVSDLSLVLRVQTVWNSSSAVRVEAF